MVHIVGYTLAEQLFQGIHMHCPLPEGAARATGVKLTPWMADPDGDYCSLRCVEGTDPSVIANRVAFIEKTPRVRIQPCSNALDDWKNWHSGYKGDGGWDEVSQGWCDAQLIALGYDVPAPQPYADSMYDV